MPHIIYALVDPRDEAIGYVGRTSVGLTSRLYSHIQRSCATPRPGKKDMWIRELLASGLAPVARELARTSSPERAANLEREWISRSRGPRLTNTQHVQERSPRMRPHELASFRSKQAIGTNNGRATLDEERLRLIRQEYRRVRIPQTGMGRPMTSNRHELAKKYGVSPTMVTRIAEGKAWKHVKGRT